MHSKDGAVPPTACSAEIYPMMAPGYRQSLTCLECRNAALRILKPRTHELRKGHREPTRPRNRQRYPANAYAIPASRRTPGNMLRHNNTTILYTRGLASRLVEVATAYFLHTQPDSSAHLTSYQNRNAEHCLNKKRPFCKPQMSNAVHRNHSDSLASTSPPQSSSATRD